MSSPVDFEREHLTRNVEAAQEKSDKAWAIARNPQASPRHKKDAETAAKKVTEAKRALSDHEAANPAFPPIEDEGNLR